MTGASSWLPVASAAPCPRCGTRLWIRQVWEPLCWWWEHMCPECRLTGHGQSPEAEAAAS